MNRAANIHAVIFDLDDTLFDCTGQLTEPARRRAADILASSAPDLTPSSAHRFQAECAESMSSTEAIREIGRRYSIAETTILRALSAYNQPDVPSIVLFQDALETLARLSEAGLALALVTTGSPERQTRKIDRLGLEPFFSVNKRTLFLHDPSTDGPDKAPHLEQAATATGFPPWAVAVIGDKLDAEIEAGNRLGMMTIRLRQGRQRESKPAAPEQTPRYEIDALSDAIPLLLANV